MPFFLFICSGSITKVVVLVKHCMSPVFPLILNWVVFFFLPMLALRGSSITSRVELLSNETPFLRHDLK